MSYPQMPSVEVPEIGWYERAARFLGRREVWQIEGNSMYPALRDGDAVLVDPQAGIVENDIVVARHPFRTSVTFVKRVRLITGDGRYFVVGDNPTESEDSRSFGAVRPEDVVGKVVCRIRG